MSVKIEQTQHIKPVHIECLSKVYHALGRTNHNIQLSICGSVFDYSTAWIREKSRAKPITLFSRSRLVCCVGLKFYVNILPISGAKRHEFPISGNPFGPGMSAYGRTCVPFDISFSVAISGGGTSFGKMLIADENAVRFTREFAAVRVLIFSTKF